MGGHHHHIGVLDDGVDALTGFFAEGRIAGAEHFIDQQNIRVSGGGDGKADAGAHARRIGAHGQMQIVAKFAKFDDLRQGFFDLAIGHTQKPPHKAHVLNPGAVDIKPDIIGEEGGNTAPHRALTFISAVDPGQNAQQRAFARAVIANQAHAIACIYFKIQSIKGPDEGSPLRRGDEPSANRIAFTYRVLMQARHGKKQGQIFDFDGRC